MSATGIDKVLIIKAMPGANRALEELIMKSLKHPHEIIWNSLKEDGMKMARNGDYGLLIVSGSVLDPGLRRACRAAVNHPTASILFLADEPSFRTPEEKESSRELLDIGATILNRPLTQSAFATAVQAADMAHIRLGALKKKLDDERIISRCKLVLIQTLGLSEDEAHKFIEKEAMNSGRTRIEVAYEILKTYE